MKHIPRRSFDSRRDNGTWILPAQKFITYCNKEVFVEDIDAEHCDCESCLDTEFWEMIDCDLGTDNRWR